MFSIVSVQQFRSYPGRGLEETHMACADIRKLWKLFDKKAAIGELWYLVPGFQKKFSGMFIYNIRINHSDSAAYLVT